MANTLQFAYTENIISPLLITHVQYWNILSRISKISFLQSVYNSYYPFWIVHVHWKHINVRRQVQTYKISIDFFLFSSLNSFNCTINRLKSVYLDVLIELYAISHPMYWNRKPAIRIYCLLFFAGWPKEYLDKNN